MPSFSEPGLVPRHAALVILLMSSLSCASSRDYAADYCPADRVSLQHALSTCTKHESVEKYLHSIDKKLMDAVNATWERDGNPVSLIAQFGPTGNVSAACIAEVPSRQIGLRISILIDRLQRMAPPDEARCLAGTEHTITYRLVRSGPVYHSGDVNPPFP